MRVCTIEGGFPRKMCFSSLVHKCLSNTHLPTEVRIPAISFSVTEHRFIYFLLINGYHWLSIDDKRGKLHFVT